MRLIRVPCLVSLAVLAGAGGLGAQEPFIETPYYPVKVGTRWEYRLKGQNTPIIMRVAKHEPIDGKLCALVETVVDNNVVASEHIRPEKDGVYRYTSLGQKAEPPLMFLKLPPAESQTWKVETQIMGQAAKGTFTMEKEQIEVPYSKNKLTAFVCKSADMEAAGQKISTITWFVEGVGMARQHANIAGTEVVLELQKFEQPQ